MHWIVDIYVANAKLIDATPVFSYFLLRSLFVTSMPQEIYLLVPKELEGRE
jgi:hypothetical protein